MVRGLFLFIPKPNKQNNIPTNKRKPAANSVRYNLDIYHLTDLSARSNQINWGITEEPKDFPPGRTFRKIEKKNQF